MLNPLQKSPSTLTVTGQYAKWRCDFMLQRLRVGLLIAALSLTTFVVLNLVLHAEAMAPPLWLFSNITQLIVVLICLILIYLRLCLDPAIIMLLFSWSITLIPQFEALMHGEANFDHVTWTLVFLGQTTLVPVRWKIHLLSYVGVFVCFFMIQLFFQVDPDPLLIEKPVFYYLYLFWFCVICNVSVYLYENLQHNEFKTKSYLEVEQKKTEDLLLNIFPRSIVERLKQEDTTIADNFTHVTVLFADIVGFTELSLQMSPRKLVELLNDIFCEFDDLVEQHGIEKIKTIGDAYMVVAGLPRPRPDHAERIANLALDMLQAISRFDDKYQFRLSIRIGIHTGPVVAGIIGNKKFAYDLWGDTVNTASRMESQGVAGRIQISDKVYQALVGKYAVEERGIIQIKGRGEMNTYFLNGKLLDWPDGF